MKYLFAAAALVVLAATPAAAKSMKMSCAADGPSKMTTAMAGMPFDERMIMMNKSQADMNTAMSTGNMRACNKAMMKGQKAMMMKSKMMM